MVNFTTNVTGIRSIHRVQCFRSRDLRLPVLSHGYFLQRLSLVSETAGSVHDVTLAIGLFVAIIIA